MAEADSTGKIASAKKSRKGIKLKRHGLSGNPLWNRWRRMVQRCHGSETTIGPAHGARGIQVCQRWRESFEAFLADMGEPPTPQHQIERIDNNGDYEPGNCRWATPAEQARNTRQNAMHTIDGVTKCLAEWMDTTTLPRSTVEARLKRGWTIKDALRIPSQIGKPLGRPDGTKHCDLTYTRNLCTIPALIEGERMPLERQAEQDSCKIGDSRPIIGHSKDGTPIRLPYPADNDAQGFAENLGE